MITAKPTGADGDDAGAGARPDAQLVAAVARGEVAAFRTVLERYSPAIHRLAYRLVGEASEDVVQETFLRLWTHAGKWRPQREGDLLPWLRRVATNLCFDRQRRRRFHGEDAGGERADETAPADARLIARSVADIAAAAVRALPDKQRAAIVLTYYEEQANAAAADVLGMNLKAFESLLFRARAALRQAMADADLHPSDLEGVR